GFLNSKERSTYGALFAQGTYHFTDKLALTAGLRGQAERIDASQNNSYAIAASPSIPLCGGYPLNLISASLTPLTSAPPSCLPANGHYSHDTGALTWNVTGEYHPTEGTMLYATVSRGWKAFGYNLGFGAPPRNGRQFKDEYVDNYELGVKSS